MEKDRLDQDGRYIIQDYAQKRPFASFLPGISGELGIPLWAFYVNRGQAIASFGVEHKDNPIMEFEPANKAYQNTSYIGFRTFLKLKYETERILYEPFSPWNATDQSSMLIGLNDLELQTNSMIHDIQTSVLYFILPGESFAGLVRQVTVTNLSEKPLALEILDGMPRVIPFGADNRSLKEMGRTIEAWMAVNNLENGTPFYRFQASADDTTEISEIKEGHFYFAFDGSGTLLQPFVDPTVIFGQNTTLSQPDQFEKKPLSVLKRQPQITAGRTPCGFFATDALIEPSDSLSIFSIIGNISNIERIHHDQKRLTQPAYIQLKHQEARQLTSQITDAIATQTSSPRFDAYIRQTFLDNVLRGGWPICLGDEGNSAIYHIFSRKHGDLERDYNYFYLAAEPYSQGHLNYRDVNQNRRCDVLFKPEVGEFNVLALLGLIQADGYNPLVVEGSRFTLPAAQWDFVKEQVIHPEKLTPFLSQSFTPGQLLRTISDREIGLKVSPDFFVNLTLSRTDHHFDAKFGEGYWIDHWTYNLDLIETYLSIYPDKKDELLFKKATIPYYESPAKVQPRTRKYVLVDGKVRQYAAVIEDEEKANQITNRSEMPNLARTDHGAGEVYRTTVFTKLIGLALIKFSTLDPFGMGIEMEAGKPGWYDALNGLPGLFGSSMCETYELERLLTFLRGAWGENPKSQIELPIEQHSLLHEAEKALADWQGSSDPDRDFQLWDRLATARENYRERVKLGFNGQTITFSYDKLMPILDSFLEKLHFGILRAIKMNKGLPPTYFAYQVMDYAPITDANGKILCDEQDRPFVQVKEFEPILLPMFLEGPVHALKINTDLRLARDLYSKIKMTNLYDQKLGMYKVNTSLERQSHEIGRARAFTPGWLENESIWLHMEYKYLLEVLRAGLYDEFFTDFQRAGIPFLNPAVYGRSILENSSFLVSSSHPDDSLHGAGFVARLSGATAEFLSMWNIMMTGKQPFQFVNEELCLNFIPALPGWLFDSFGRITFTFLGHTKITYHNPRKLDTWKIKNDSDFSMVLHLPNHEKVKSSQRLIKPPYAEMIRSGKIKYIDVYL